ncbi:MAG TPA: DeoR/GlpR family DNA-binding transcription regulator [Anaerolineae bacterium]|nr:DeoR/GlpR family DNA-binding transcription regulator [Anaerolineae bacterium]
MLKLERQNLILQHLKTAGALHVSDLAAQLRVDPVTIRRDLAEMEKKGLLHRVHGGAVLRNIPSPTLPGIGLKGRIAETAARFIPDHSVVFLSPGVFTPELVPFLHKHEQLTIITSALDVGWYVAQQQRHTLHLLGGQVKADFGAYGDPAALHQIQADWIVLEVAGLDVERGITHDHRDYAEMARVLFNLGAQMIALAAPEVLGRAGAVFIAPASEVDILITGREAPNPTLWDLSELGVRIVLA